MSTVITSTLADKLEELDDLIRDLKNDRDAKDLRIAELEHELEEANDRIAELIDEERRED